LGKTSHITFTHLCLELKYLQLGVLDFFFCIQVPILKNCYNNNQIDNKCQHSCRAPGIYLFRQIIGENVRVDRRIHSWRTIINSTRQGIYIA